MHDCRITARGSGANEGPCAQAACRLGWRVFKEQQLAGEGSIVSSWATNRNVLSGAEATGGGEVGSSSDDHGLPLAGTRLPCTPYEVVPQGYAACSAPVCTQVVRGLQRSLCGLRDLYVDPAKSVELRTAWDVREAQGEGVLCGAARPGQRLPCRHNMIDMSQVSCLDLHVESTLKLFHINAWKIGAWHGMHIHPTRQVAARTPVLPAWPGCNSWQQPARFCCTGQLDPAEHSLRYYSFDKGARRAVPVRLSLHPQPSCSPLAATLPCRSLHAAWLGKRH